MLKGKTAVITGASRGIGAAVAVKLAARGADIAVIYAGNVEAANQVCKECIEQYGVKAVAYKCNVADFSQVRETVAQIKKDFGTVHILINNAGITKDGLLAMMSEDCQRVKRFRAYGKCGTVQLLGIEGGNYRSDQVRCKGAGTARNTL